MKIVQFFLCVCLLAGCQSSPPPSSSGKPTVLVSLAPYAYVVKKLSGSLVEVDTLVPTGANPHLYEAPPKRVEQHQKAALWVYVGENFDRKMLQFLQENPTGILTVDVTEGIDLLGDGHTCCEHSAKDLHLWMSPPLVKVQSQKIAQALMTVLPQHKEEIEKNLQVFLQELDTLDATLAQILAPKRGESILVSHPAFAYFCKEYGLNQLSVEIAGKEPKPQEIAHLLTHAKEAHVEVVITEPQHSNKGAEAVAHLLGVQTQMIDPYTEDYAHNLLTLAHLIASHE